MSEAATPLMPRPWQEEKGKSHCLQLSLVAPGSLLLLYLFDNPVVNLFACIPLCSSGELDAVYKNSWIMAR